MQETSLTPIKSADESDVQTSHPVSNIPDEPADLSDEQPNVSDTSQIHTPQSVSAKYQFIKKIGQGSQAKVFLARRHCDGQMVAIKQLDIASVSTWKEYDLFRRECAVLSSLNIDGVARFYEAIECLDKEPPSSYLVQEYIEGESLGAMLKAGRRFSTDEVYDILVQMLTILYQLQSRSEPVIHRDIKPSNIMLTPVNEGYRVTLIDFGAVANPQIQSGGSTVAGTYGYMPPEQLMGRPQPASDIYSLAAVAVELFTGKSPATLPVKDFRLIFEPEMETQPPELVSTLRRMLEPNINERMCDCLQLIQTFKHYSNGDYKLEAALKPLDSKFEKKLSDVTDFGASGNIDLWQRLDDVTPRNVPKVYRFADWADNKTTIRDNRSKHYLLIAFISFLVLLLSGFFFALSSDSFAAIAKPGLIISSIMLLASAFISVMSIDARRRERQESIENKPIGLPYEVSDLLQNGRKTIATIVSIDYQPVSNTEQYKNLILANERPHFKICYKFNPPDDLRSEDLIHECCVFSAPDKNYRVGDPIPILYKLDGENFDETVRSMPFPYPLEFVCAKNLICESSTRNDYWKYANYFKSKGSFKFIEYRNNPEQLKDAIDRLSSYRGLYLVEIQSNLLPILNCYLTYEKYSPVHRSCINYMLWCAKQWPRVISDVNTYIQNFLSNMCANGIIKSPQALGTLLREARSTTVLDNKTKTQLAEITRGLSQKDLNSLLNDVNDI